VGGSIDTDTVWNKSGSPYIAYSDIVVEKGVTLSIEKGVTVRFKKDVNDQHGKNAFDLELLVRGTLEATGAEGDTIQFTSDASRPTWFDWQGIVVDGEDAVARLEGVRVEYANQGILVEDGRLEGKTLTVQRCSQQGILIVRGEGVLDNLYQTEIGNTGGTGIGVWLDRNAQVEIKNSYLVGVQNGISFSRGAGGSIHHSVVSLCVGNGIMIRGSVSRTEVYNCSITGNEYGFSLSGGATPNIHHNNIFKNGVSDIWFREYTADTPVKVDLSNNWWEFTDIGLIEERIVDGINDPTIKAFAILEPFLTDAVSTDSERP